MDIKLCDNDTLRELGLTDAGRISADMHTHSENSHDSTCTLSDMLDAQLKAGNNIFANTDHCDIFAYRDMDIFTPIKRSFDCVRELNEKSNGRYLVLSGVEIGEGFWHPEEFQKALSFLPYDVIIGSVHSIEYAGSDISYSQIDFGKFTMDEIHEFLDIYFSDVLKAAREYDIDILAHITCPIRYITGKYGISVELERYYPVIEEILKTVISRGISLEANISSFDLLGDFMPDTAILGMYRSLGGSMLTLGSDAHSASNAGCHFDTGKKILKDTGFSELIFYKGRTPYRYKI